jgi:hypothetical protein
MDETLRFFIGLAIFLAVIAYEWTKEKTGRKTS